MLFSNQYSSSF